MPRRDSRLSAGVRRRGGTEDDELIVQIYDWVAGLLFVASFVCVGIGYYNARRLMSAIGAVSEDAYEEASVLFRSAPTLSRWIIWVNPRGLTRVLKRKEIEEDPEVKHCLMVARKLRLWGILICLTMLTWTIGLPLLAGYMAGWE